MHLFLLFITWHPLEEQIIRFRNRRFVKVEQRICPNLSLPPFCDLCRCVTNKSMHIHACRSLSISDLKDKVAHEHMLAE